jgi:hypothetical protein
MLCPSCHADNADDASECSVCGTKLVSSASRRVPRASDSDGGGEQTGRSLAWTAFRCSVYGLIPFVGLVMGPIALVLGFVAWQRGHGVKSGRGVGPAIASMLLGGFIAFTNWLGLALMLYGLFGQGGS